MADFYTKQKKRGGPFAIVDESGKVIAYAVNEQAALRIVFALRYRKLKLGEA